MSTETITLEKIVIHRGDKQNDEIREALKKYLLQFVHGTRIQSLSNLTLQIKIDDTILLNLRDEFCLDGKMASWQTDDMTRNAISRISSDCETEVTLHFDLFQWYSDTIVYGTRFWADVLENSGCRSVTYRGLEYYDTDPEIQILRFENGEISYSGDEVPASESVDIPSWYTQNFELALETEDEFTEEQYDRLRLAAEEVEHLCGEEEPFDFDVSEVHINSSITLQREDVQVFRAFLEKVVELAIEANASIELSAEFVPNETDDFAALYFTVRDAKIVTQFVCY